MGTHDGQEGQAGHAINLAELLRLKEKGELLACFCDSVGVAAAIIDLEGVILAAARWQRLCTDFHRANPATCARCVESDTDLAQRLQAGHDFAIYRCGNGLTDAAAPIIVDGQRVANVFIGQFFLGPPDLSYFRSQAEQYAFDPEAYLAAAADVPIVDERKLPGILGFLAGFARLLATLGLERLRAREAVAAAQQQAEDADRARAELAAHREHLERLVEERTAELTYHLEELERFNRLFIGREERMIELKREVNVLRAELGREPRYRAGDQEASSSE